MRDQDVSPFPKYEATVTVRMRFEATTDSIAAAFQIASNLVKVEKGAQHEIVYVEVKKMP